MSMKREDFDVPVEDYDFSQIGDVPSLINQMANAGGFTATKLAHARDVLREAMDKSGTEGAELAFIPRMSLRNRLKRILC